MYDALIKKVIYGHFQCDTVTNKDIMVTCCDINLTGFVRLNHGHLFRSYGHICKCIMVTLCYLRSLSVSKLNSFFKE